MVAQATHNVRADLARLDEAAESAGQALACVHQSAEEFHGELIRRYFALHPRRRPIGYALGGLALLAFLILI